jgi:hypothetical protein
VQDEDHGRDFIAGLNRRVFMGRVVAGLGLAFPAFRMLARPGKASAQIASCSATGAALAPASGCSPCDNTYLVYEGHYCGSHEGCPTGYVAYCIGHYHKYAVSTGQYCGLVTDNEGPCGG